MCEVAAKPKINHVYHIYVVYVHNSCLFFFPNDYIYILNIAQPALATLYSHNC